MRKEKLLIAFTVCVFGISCQKGTDNELLNKGPRENNQYSSVSRLSYGENIYYVSQKNSSNIVTPVSTPDFEGHFTSIPSGLDLDRKTGKIDLGNSQSGQPYKIFYVNKKGILTDSARIVISGLDYVDGIYDAESNKTKFGQKSTAIYNGDQSSPIASSSFNSFAVSFSTTDDDSEDVTGLAINKRNGSLDLRKSKIDGLFGRKPVNGANKEIVIKYRLADKSARKLKIQRVILFYFSDETKIPRSLLKIIEERQRIMERVNAMPLPGHSGEGTEDENLTEESLLQFDKPVRPPLIVVT